jgi:tetratricopeptide (TPR) repeat protein
MTAQTVPDYLAIIKDDWIVGRQSESSVFYNNIIESNPEYSIFIITGPGGIGKPTLLRWFEILGKAEQCLIGKCDAETENAISCFSKAIDINEKKAQSDQDRFPWAFMQRGIALKMMGKLQESLNDLNRAIILEPKYEIQEKIQLISAKLAKNGENN